MIDKEQVQRDMLEVWCGDWQHKHMEKIRATGVATVAELLARHPAVALRKLLRELRLLIAPMQLKTLQFDEAIRRGRVRDAAKDLLVRTLNDVTKHGWGRGGHWESNRATVYSDFINDMETHSHDAAMKDTAVRVWRALCEANPPAGWLPKSTEDPLIQKAFDVAWPER